MTTREQILAARAILTDRQRRVLDLRLAGHSWRTIADSLGIHEATARGHHQRALDRIETALRKDAA